MPLSKEEARVLRELGQRYASYAALPVQNEKRRLWRCLNRCRPERPMVLIDQIPWHEMDVDGSLVCRVSDPYWRWVENRMRQDIYKWEHMPADLVLPPYFALPKVIDCTGYGLEIKEETAVTDAANSVVGHAFVNQIREPEDIEKIHTPRYIYRKEQTEAIRQEAEQLFEGILPVRMYGVTLHLGVWDFITQWMGVENVYIELMDRPEFMHALMERVTACTEEMIQQLDRDGLFDVDTQITHCSHTFSDDLPTAACDRENPHARDVWAFGLAQLFTSVSPSITAEFEVPYMKRLFPYFGAIYYGCCDRLDDRLDVITQMPGIRKISCSPWSDREHFAEQLPRGYVMSNKPNPALVGAADMDETAVRADIRRTVEAARSNGKPLELILKDISTVQYQPQRLWDWSRIALEEVSR